MASGHSASQVIPSQTSYALKCLCFPLQQRREERGCLDSIEPDSALMFVLQGVSVVLIPLPREHREWPRIAILAGGRSQLDGRGLLGSRPSSSPEQASGDGLVVLRCAARPATSARILRRQRPIGNMQQAENRILERTHPPSRQSKGKAASPAPPLQAGGISQPMMAD